jgi:hypothetical protein
MELGVSMELGGTEEEAIFCLLEKRKFPIKSATP